MFTVIIENMLYKILSYTNPIKDREDMGIKMSYVNQ